MADARLSDLQKAFALATKCAESDTSSLEDRNQYRAIAHLIWKSLGQPNDEEIPHDKAWRKYVQRKFSGWDKKKLLAQAGFLRETAHQQVEVAAECEWLAAGLPTDDSQVEVER